MIAISSISTCPATLSFLTLLTCLSAVSSTSENTEDLLRQHGYFTKIQYSPIKRSDKARRCAGVVYNAYWIITSAKCALNSWRRKIGNPTHDIGDVLVSEDIPLPRCKPQDLKHYRYVVDVAVPPGLGNWAWGFLPKHTQPDPAIDIGLLKVNEPFEFSKDFWPIRLPESRKDCGTDKAYFLGWDITHDKDSEKQWRNGLRKVEMDVLGGKECTEYDPKFDSISRICARASGGSTPANGTTCYSDIGGPLVRVVDVTLQGSPFKKGDHVLCGILPMSSCKRSDLGKTTQVEFFTNVVQHKEWITKTAGAPAEWEALSTEETGTNSEGIQKPELPEINTDGDKETELPEPASEENNKPASTAIMERHKDRDVDQCNLTGVNRAQGLAHTKLEGLSVDVRTLAESVGKMIQVLDQQRLKIQDLSAKLVLQNQLVALLQAKMAKFAENQTLLTKKATKIDLILHDHPLPGGSSGAHFVAVAKGR